MSNYETPVLTNRGLAILTQKDSGNDEGPPLKLTKMAIGTGILPLDQKPEELTDLICKLKDIHITDFEITGLGLSDVTGEINNIGIEEEAPIFEIGVYAEDPKTLEDVLYTYTYTRNTPTTLSPPKTTLYLGEHTVKTIISRDAKPTVNVVKPERAKNIAYDNIKSGIDADDIQKALDEITLMTPVETVIEHGLEGFPSLRIIAFEHGYGQNYGKSPYGGGGPGLELQSKVVYDDRNHLHISVAKELEGTPIVERAGRTEFFIRYPGAILYVQMFENHYISSGNSENRLGGQVELITEAAVRQLIVKEIAMLSASTDKDLDNIVSTLTAKIDAVPRGYGY